MAEVANPKRRATPKLWKHNPAFLSDQELIEQFCVRGDELSRLVDELRPSADTSSRHSIVTGPRGSGKTTLLLRVAAEVRRDAELKAAWVPVVFPEDGCRIATPAEFWLQCLLHLSQQAPRAQDRAQLRSAHDSLSAALEGQIPEGECVNALAEFARARETGVVVLIDALDVLLDQVADPDLPASLHAGPDGESPIRLIGSSANGIAAKDARWRAFQEHPLKGLDSQSCATLWNAVALGGADWRSIRPLEILTGGNPRLLASVARLAGQEPAGPLIRTIMELADQHTADFRGRLEALGPQDRSVFLALADLWAPATASQVSRLARLPTSHCSAILKRLVERGAVIRSGGVRRRWEYGLAERMHSICYLLRRGRAAGQSVESLVRFMDAFYRGPGRSGIRPWLAAGAPAAENDRRTILRSGVGAQPEVSEPGTTALAMWGNLRAGVLQGALDLVKIPTPRSASRQPAGRAEANAESAASVAVRLIGSGRYRQGIRVCERVEGLLQDVRSSRGEQCLANAWSAHAIALDRLGHLDEAVGVCDRIIDRFGQTRSSAFDQTVAAAFATKVALLDRLDRPRDVVAAGTAFDTRFTNGRPSAFEAQRAVVQCVRALALLVLRKQGAAMTFFEAAIDRFGTSSNAGVRDLVAISILGKADILHDRGHVRAASEAYDDGIAQLAESESPAASKAWVSLMLYKGRRLVAEGHLREASECFDAVSAAQGPRGGARDAPLHITVELGRKRPAEDRLGATAAPRATHDPATRGRGPAAAQHPVEIQAGALAGKISSLLAAARIGEAAAAADDLVRRFGSSEDVPVLDQVGGALLEVAKAEFRTGHLERALATAGRVPPKLASSYSESLAMARLLQAEANFLAQRPDQARAALLAALEVLPERADLLGIYIGCLMEFAVRLGPGPVLRQIERSATIEALLPLVAVLRSELGVETKAPPEVDAVARDVRDGLALLRIATAPAERHWDPVPQRPASELQSAPA